MFHVKHRLGFDLGHGGPFHVKHRDAEELRFAHELLEEVGLPVSDEGLEFMLRHVDWAIHTSHVLNLTAMTDRLTAIRLHIVDSLTALPEVGKAPSGTLLDLGTGGGFPGLELALASRRRAVLVDSVKKKADALERFLMHENLAPWVSVSGLRAEELAAKEPECAAVVTARAVGPLPSLVELASPLLGTGGLLVAMKGRLGAEELERGRRGAERCGMKELSIRRFTLPRGGEERAIVAYRKIGAPKQPLPRRVGLAQRRPLA